MKYLKVVFEDATLFRNNRSTKDVVLLSRNGGTANRLDTQNENYEEPITVFQVSNLIHVLFGERPVPTFRNVFYKPLEYYLNKASESYLFVETFNKYNKNKDCYIDNTETIQTKKSVWNSFTKSVDINWFVIKKYMCNKYSTSDLYGEFIKASNNLFGMNVEEMPFCELRKLYLSGEHDTTYILDMLSTNKKTGLSNYLRDPNKTGGEITAHYINGTRRTYNNGLDKVSVINGSMLIPMDESDMERLKIVSSGISTILDGGLIYIDGVYDDYELDELYKYKKVCEISLKKVKYENKN